MARRAVNHAFQVVFLFQAFADCFLLGGRRMPIEIEDAIARPDVSLGLAMTIEAPFHQQRALLADELHFVDWPVTACAADAFGNMDTVIEVNMIRQLVHAIPFNGSISLVSVAHRCQQFAADPDLLMASHAGLDLRHPGIGRCLDGGVAVAAINAQCADVLLMAERHRLIADDPALVE